MKFYVCEKGGTALLLTDGDCPGPGLKELVPGTADAALEKHVPVRLDGTAERVTVSVGQVEHPMEAQHWIQWIALETDRGVCVRRLRPGQPPQAEFALLPGEKALAAYAYCNLHGLWKA